MNLIRFGGRAGPIMINPDPSLVLRVIPSRNFQIMINHKLDPVGPVAWGLPIMTAISQRIYDEMT